MNQTNYTTKQWKYLSTKWTEHATKLGIKTIQFTLAMIGNEPIWRILEQYQEETLFSFTRSCITLDRKTETNLVGLLGITLIDFENPKCFITEGVSDFFTLKLLLPNCNVLGVTNLGASKFAKSVLVSIFKEIVVVADSDRAGLATANSYKELFESNGVKCKIYIPTSKDVTREVLLTHANVKQKLSKL